MLKQAMEVGRGNPTDTAARLVTGTFNEEESIGTSKGRVSMDTFAGMKKTAEALRGVDLGCCVLRPGLRRRRQCCVPPGRGAHAGARGVLQEGRD